MTHQVSLEESLEYLDPPRSVLMQTCSIEIRGARATNLVLSTFLDLFQRQTCAEESIISSRHGRPKREPREPEKHPDNGTLKKLKTEMVASKSPTTRS